VIDIVSAIERRGAPVAANKALKVIKTFFRWSVGRAVLDRSPADGVPLPAKQVARDRVLSDSELARVLLAARQPQLCITLWYIWIVILAVRTAASSLTSGFPDIR